MMMAGSSADVSTVAKSSEAASIAGQNALAPAWRARRGHVDVLQIRQPVADSGELLPSGLVGDDGLGAGIRQAEFQRVLAEQREQRHRNQPGPKSRQMHDRQFQRLRQEHRDPVAARKPSALSTLAKRRTSPASRSNEMRCAPPSSST